MWFDSFVLYLFSADHNDLVKGVKQTRRSVVASIREMRWKMITTTTSSKFIYSSSSQNIPSMRFLGTQYLP